MLYLSLALSALVSANPDASIATEQNIFPVMARMTMDGIIGACKSADPGISGEYDREFSAWKVRHADALRSKEAYAARQIEPDGRSRLDHAQEESESIVHDFLLKQPDAQIDGCRTLLMYMESL